MASAALELLITLRDEATGPLGAVTGALGSLGTVVAGVAVGGFVALGAAMVSGLQDARGAAQLFASTEQTIASMGNAAGVSAQHVVDMASALSDAAGKSLFGDDQIQASTNLLLTFGQIKGATLDAATALTVDLAQALGGEPQAQAMMLGKALNDPVKGLTALGKAGLTFSEEQKAVIAAMVESGDIAGAQAIIIEELNKQVGGQAAAAASAAGGWVQFKAGLGEAAETAMTGLLPALDAMSGILNTSVMPVINAVAGAFGGVIDALVDAGPMSSEFGEAMGFLASQLGLPGELIQNIVFAVQDFVASLQPTVQAITTFVSNGSNLQAILFGIGTALTIAVIPALVSVVASFLALSAPIIAVVAAGALLYGAWQSNFLGIRDIAASVWAFLQPIFAQLITWLQQNIPIAIAAAAQVWTNTLQPALQAAGAFITGTVIPAISMVVAWLQTNIPAAISAASTAFQNIAATVSSVASSIQSAIGVVVTVVQAAWNTIAFITSAVWGSLVNLVGPVISQIAAVISPVLAQIQSGWQTTWGAVQSVTASVMGAVQGVIQGAISFIQGVWGGGTSAIQTQTTGVWGQIQGVIQSAIGVIRSVVEAGIAVVQSIMATAWSIIAAAAENDFGRIPGIIGAGWESIKGLFSAGIEAVKGAFGQFASDAAGLGGAIVDGIASGISGAVGGLVSAAVDAATSALDAAKSALGISSPSRVMADQVGEPLIQGIVQGILSAAPKVSKAMVGVIEGLLNVIANGLGAFEALREFRAIPMQALLDFEAALGQVLATFIALSSTYNKKLLGAAITFSEQTAVVVGVIGSAVEAFAALREFQAPLWTTVEAFKRTLDHVMSAVVEMTLHFTAEGLAFAGLFAETAGKVVQMVGAGVTAFAGLREFEAPAYDTVSAFARTLNHVMSAIAEMTLHFEEQGVAFAGVFADAAGKVVAMIGAAVASFAALNDSAPVAVHTIQLFRDAIAAVVTAMVEVAARFTAEGLAAANAFAETAQAAIGLIANGVGAFNELRDFAQVPYYAISFFASAVLQMMNGLVAMVNQFSAEAVARARAFAETAQEVVAIIGAGVEGFNAMRDFAQVPYYAISFFISAILQMMNGLTAMVGQFSAETIAAAEQFAASANEGIRMLSEGAAGFAAIRDFAPVPYYAISFFMSAILQMMNGLASMVSQFSVEVLDTTQRFAEAAGAAVGILASGVDGFLKLATFQGVPAAAIAAFAQALNATVIAIATIAQQWSTEALDAASRFATTAGAVVGLLGSGVDGLIKLKDLTEVPASAIALFAEAVRQMVVQIAGLAAQWTVEALDAARVFAEGASAVVSLMGEALDAFAKLADFKAVGGDLIAAFASGLASLLSQFQGIALPAATDLGTQIIQGMAAAVTASTPNLVNAILAAVQSALQAARQALGIASPSKVFADQVGLPMAQGMALGLGRGAPLVAGAVRSVGSAAVGAAVTNNYTYNLTYSDNAPSTGSAAQDIRLLSILTQ